MIRDILVTLKRYLIGHLTIYSLKAALAEQNLFGFYKQVNQRLLIIPDVGTELFRRYAMLKKRMQNAFQLKLVQMVVGEEITDIGGTYCMSLLYKKATIVNIDTEIVEEAKEKGLDAIRADIEDFDYPINEIIWGFEVLEHLKNPVKVLERLSGTFVFAVPYLYQSRIGLKRSKKSLPLTPANTHIFELSPKDWRMLFEFCGWKVAYDEIYLQYPKKNILLKHFWRKYDFEGFYGGILRK